MDTTSGSGDKAFNGGGVKTSSKFLLLGFNTRNDRDGEKVFVYLTVEGENVSHFLVGFSFGEVGSVAFLPQEFASS